MRRRVWSGSVVLVVLVAGIVLAAGGSGPGPERPRGALEPEQAAASASPGAGTRTLVMVRRHDGLPASWVRRLRRDPAVDGLTGTFRTQWLLRRATTAGGVVRDAPRPGYAIPLDTSVVDPRAYARVTGETAFRRLRAGRVLLSATSARLRRLGPGGRMTLAGGRTVRVAGIVSDAVARDAEVVAAAADVPRAERRQAVVVVATRDPEAVADALPDDPQTRIAILDPRATTRGGNITRALFLKQRFGEFAVRLPYGEDWIRIDPVWQQRNVVTRSVPILGRVTCHRALIAPLRRALGRLRRARLGRLVDPGDYAGCHAPRRIPGSGSLSLHAWGLAVDLNASENPLGATPRLDARVVRAMEREGFAWGGRWPTVPDGMHFELHPR